MIKTLREPLEVHLPDAKELFVAVALMKDYGLNIIEQKTPSDCRRKYLVGVHLPTSPTVLRRLLAMSNPPRIQSKIFSKQVFHPKVYIIRKANKSLVVFVGSANATNGGFNKNVELGVRVENQQSCEQALQWFNNLFEEGIVFDKTYIDRYELIYRKNRILDSIKKSNINNLINQAPLQNGTQPIVPVEQFFRQSDFDAFAPNTHLVDTLSAKEERSHVRLRLLELHDAMINKFSTYGINNLHTAKSRLHYTSQWYHSRGYTHIPKDAIWLHYGKSVEELEKYATKTTQKFVNHLRMQLILRNALEEQFIGIWLYVGDPNRSWHDRSNLIKKIKSVDFLSLLYEYILKLGDSYWISIGKRDVYISELKNEQSLFDTLSRDNFQVQFIIGRNYSPDDPDLSTQNIEETVLIEFSKLYKIYDLIKDA